MLAQAPAAPPAPRPSLQAMAGAPAETPRAIRRDVPMTNAIRRAFEAGTRDWSGRPGPNYWQLENDYTIQVRLDPATRTLTGSETITLHNNSPQALQQIMLRLDHNMYRGLVPRAAPWTPAENTDGCVITRLMVNGEAVNLSAPPADGRGGGRGRGGAGGGAAAPRQLSVSGLQTTLATINLATPIAARSDATLTIDWHTQLPGGPDGRNHRMTQRFEDRLFQPTQWFPRVAKYDDLRGWDTNLYLGPSEFYNNFGRFDVRIDVPAGWIVSGTGVLQNPNEVLTPVQRERLSHVLESDSITTISSAEEVGPGQATAAGDRLVWHLVADKVNDFAWATARKFVWQATRATIPGKGPVPIHMVFEPDHANLYTNAGSIARHALEFYSRLWSPYPFPQFTLQDGPSAGMEYPMVINSNQGAADHETGHQWWPMVVGNNETWYGWMDEGFNQYMNILSAADTKKTPANLDGRAQGYGRISGNEDEPPMMWNANYAGPAMYGFQTYQKTPLMLSSLGGIVGDEAVQKAMSEYTKAWSFKHPSPWDYINFMNGQLKQDLNWFWYYWLFTTESVNGSIAAVTTTAGKSTVTVRQDGQMPSPVVLQVQFAEKGAPLKVTATSDGKAGANAGPSAGPSNGNVKMLNDRTALVTWPVDVWFSGNRTFKAVIAGGRAIESITLDPGGRFPDVDASDNVWPKK